MAEREPYPTDVSDEEWEFVAPYLTLMKEDAPQRDYPLREVFNALRWIVRSGAAWRLMPHEFPPYYVVYQQTQRWIRAGVLDQIVHDLRAILRLCEGKNTQPSAAVLDSRTLRGSVENGDRGGYDGHKKKKGSKLHMAVDTLGYLLALHVTPANEQDRDQVEKMAAEVQEVTGQRVKVMFVDQGYTGDDAKEAAAKHGIELQVVKRPDASKGFVLLPKRWVVERSFGWLTRFRRLVKDYERLPQTVAGLHFAACAILMLGQLSQIVCPQS